MNQNELKALRTPPRLDLAGITQSPDQRRPDEFARPFSTRADDVVEYVEAYPEDFKSLKPRHLAMARGHVAMLGKNAVVTMRQVAQLKPADRPGACSEMARRIILAANAENADEETEARIMLWLLLAAEAVV